jgi:hypothetical protein
MEQGFVRVRYAGAGLMLIKREVLEQLKERFPQLWCSINAEAQAYLGLSEGVLQCFSSFQDSKGMFMGEDVSFCRRWIDGCGRFGCISEEVMHVDVLLILVVSSTAGKVRLTRVSWRLMPISPARGP